MVLPYLVASQQMPQKYVLHCIVLEILQYSEKRHRVPSRTSKISPWVVSFYLLKLEILWRQRFLGPHKIYHVRAHATIGIGTKIIKSKWGIDKCVRPQPAFVGAPFPTYYCLRDTNSIIAAQPSRWARRAINRRLLKGRPLISMMREWRMKTIAAIRVVMPTPSAQIMFKNLRNLGGTPLGARSGL